MRANKGSVARHSRISLDSMPMTNNIDVDAICKAIASPVRRNILNWLRQPEVYFADQELPLELGVCAAAIDRRCGLAQSSVSAHLSTLTRAGLVTSKKVSQSVCFKRDEATLKVFQDYLMGAL